ncbi:hypothetical protein E6H37_03865 [Candidatus Bathyarchaeota archaeon]|nr:MAG: hypothetical protein E6H37_03865 [Candidatus Bathyarchaeota archaeon]
MRHDARSIFSLAFVAFSLSSAVYISVAAINYLSLFPAIDEITKQQSYQIDKLVLSNMPGTSEPAVQVDVSVSNPTQYSGLTLTVVDVTIQYFYADANTSNRPFQPSPSSPNTDAPESSPIGPDSTVRVTVMVPLTGSQAGQLFNFTNQNPGQITGHCNLEIDISSFLVSVLGFTSYTRTQEVPLSFS